MNKKFKIEGTIAAYVPEPFVENILTKRYDYLDSVTERLESTNSIYISNTARVCIFEHIDWAKNTVINKVEQGGLLIGHSYENEENNEITGMVLHAIPAITAKGSPAYLEFNHTTWKLMLEQLDELNEDQEGPELQVIGWYHTHPGRLSVFMSGTDLNTQVKMFNKDWQFAIVLNPQKQTWRAFNGAKAKECNGYMLK